MSIDIIGAGIGGLTTAVALQQKKFKVRLFEQAVELKPVGAGIILANNAMQVYEKLGLKHVIEEKGNRISAMNITNAKLDVISAIDLTYFEQKYGVKNIAIHRGTLQQILLNSLSTTELNLNHRLKNISANKDGYSLLFEKGDIIKSSTVIGADGIHSKVRMDIFPNNSIRAANQVCWRGVTDFSLPKKYQHELNEAWGGKDRFGFVQIAQGKVYWYALKSFEQNPDEYTVSDIQSYFKAYHPIIQSILSATPLESIFTSEMSDLKPMKKWFADRLCLIGDAAHAMTPNIGQGACQSIEDAYILSESMHHYELNRAFEEFQKLRMPKAHRIVNASWNLGKLAHLSNPVFISIRNQMMRWTPDFMSRKQSEQIFKIAKV